MGNLNLPFNITILDLTKEKIAPLHQVTSLDIFDGATNNFHEEGLFSVSIFGRTGEERRDNQFAYIQLKVKVFHPLIYKTLCTLRGLYQGIMSGTEYVTWDSEENDFKPSNELEGQTGFSYFLDHWENIDFKENKSSLRRDRIRLINKYKDIALTDKILILPAGLRDIDVSEDGRLHQDPINDLYRRIISINNVISASNYNTNDRSLDQSRKGIQRSFCEIYELLQSFVSGKKGFIQDKWASRKIFNGTRNVISAMDTSSPDLKSPRSLKLTDTVVGLYQHARAIDPITKSLLLNGFLSKVFGSVNGKAILTNKKTYKSEYVTVSNKDFDRWNTEEGLTKVLGGFADATQRHRSVVIGDHYLGLIYLGPEMVFKMFSNIDDLPSHFDRKHVFPITFCQLIYLSGYRDWNKYPALITRYPVTGLGSIYPSTAYVKTTIKSEIRKELDDNWEPIGDDHIAYEFPITSVETFIDTMAPHLSNLSALGGD